jgi:hypothetical protein
MRIAKRAGMKKATVALARRVAVVMHRMLVDGTTFTTQPAQRRVRHHQGQHVVERWKLLDSKTLELLFTADDPDTFVKPWTAAFRFHRVQRSASPYEDVCAENNFQFDYHVQVAEKPDF